MFLVGQLTAQPNFYIRPKIENKVSQSLSDKPQTKSIFNNHYNTNYYPNPYCEVWSPMFFTTKSFTLGLNIGVKFANNDLVEIGYNEDQSGSKIISRTLGYSADYPDSYHMQNRPSHSVNLINHRFEILYYKNLNSTSDSTLLNFPNSHFLFGTGLKYLPSAVTKKKPHNGQVFYNPGGSYDNISMYWQHSVFGWSKFSSFLTLGFSTDIYFNKTYLFSSSILYTVGFNVLQSTKDKLSVYENDLLIKTYNYETYSRGSGFQFQISRKLEFFPWKKLRKN